MHARWKGEVCRVPERAFLQAGLEFLAVELMRDIGLQRDRAPVGVLVGAFHRELAVLELDVALACFEHMGGDFLGLGFDFLQRLEDCRHANRAGARAVSAHAHLHLVGIAVHDRDIVDRNAEPLGDELREGRLVALPVRMRAGQDLDRADRIDPHFRRFP